MATKTIQVSDAKCVILGEENRLFVNLPGHRRVFIPKDFGYEAGDTFNGEVTIEEATYEFLSDGVTKRDVPLVRWELSSYDSWTSQEKTILAKTRIAQIPKMTFTAEMFSGLVPAKVTPAEMAG